MESMVNRAKGSLLGLACGDAVGTTLEFQKVGSNEPISEMLGGGPFDLNKGEWTDDTSMALCLGHSLVEKNGFDAKDQMDKYCRWKNEGYMSSTGVCFDIGNTVQKALTKYEQTGAPMSGSSDPYSAGNGSIMRLAPVPIFYYSKIDDVVHFSGESARTTHACKECIECTQFLGIMLYMALSGKDKDQILNTRYDATMPKVIDIVKGRYRNKSADELTGSGYVIETLETALWCFLHTTTFKEAILLSANISSDADTTAAVCGQIAGAYYGYDDIPNDWLDVLCMRNELEQLALQLLNKGEV